MSKKYYITGVSGTGKTTTIAELQKRGITAIDLDQGFCHWEHKESGERAHFSPGIGREFLDVHDWYCEVDKLKEFLDTALGPVFVSGVTANQEEYLSLFDKVFLFTAPREIFFKRIDERTDNDFGKHDTEKEHILTWYEDYEKEMLEKGAIRISTDKPVSEVVEELLGYLPS